MIKSLMENQVVPAKPENFSNVETRQPLQENSNTIEVVDKTQIVMRNKSAGNSRIKPSASDYGEMDVKVERAMLDLSEYKNNYVVEKTSYERQMQQAKKDKEARLRNTHYSGGGF